MSSELSARSSQVETTSSEGGARGSEGETTSGELSAASRGSRSHEQRRQCEKQRRRNHERRRRSEKRRKRECKIRSPDPAAASTDGAVPSHLPIPPKKPIVTSGSPRRWHKKCFIVRNQALPQGGKEQKKSRKSSSLLGNNSRKARNPPHNPPKQSKSCDFYTLLGRPRPGVGRLRGAIHRLPPPDAAPRARERAICDRPPEDSEQNGVFSCSSRQRCLHLQQRSPPVRP